MCDTWHVSLEDSLHSAWSSLGPPMLLRTACFIHFYGWAIFPCIFGFQPYLFDVDGHLGCFCCWFLVLMWTQAWPKAMSQLWGAEMMESRWYCLVHSGLWACSEPSKLETWPQGWWFIGPRAWVPTRQEWCSSRCSRGSAWKPQKQRKALPRHHPGGSQWLGVEGLHWSSSTLGGIVLYLGWHWHSFSFWAAFRACRASASPAKGM